MDEGSWRKFWAGGWVTIFWSWGLGCGLGLLSMTPWSMYWIMRSGTGISLFHTDLSVILADLTGGAVCR